MSIVKSKSRGKTYYQVRKGKTVIKTLGSEAKILKVFQYYKENAEKEENTE